MEVASDDVDVRRGDSNNSISSGDGAGPSSLGISIDISSLGQVPNRLGISIDLTNLSHCPTTPAPSTATTGTAAPLRGDPFVEPVGPTKPLPSAATAIDFFEQNFDDDLLRHIVDQTNLYVQQKRSAQYKWSNLTVPELKAFLGVAILMGIVRMPRVADYWSQESTLGEFPVITNAFPRNRFFAILWNLHFNDNSQAVPGGTQIMINCTRLGPL